MSERSRLNAFRATVKAEAFTAAGYSLWSFAYPPGHEHKSFSSIPKLLEAYNKGVVLSCVHRSDGLLPTAIALVKGDTTLLKDASLRRMELSECRLDDLVRLLLTSGDVRYWVGRQTLTGLVGTMPIWCWNEERTLATVIDLRVRSVRDDIVSVYPACTGYRTPKLAVTGRGKVVHRDDNKHTFMYRPVLKDDKVVRYVEIPGARYGKWVDGNLTKGSVIRNGKEASLPWAPKPKKGEVVDINSRSRVLHEIENELPRSRLSGILKLEPFAAEQVDRRYENIKETPLKRGDAKGVEAILKSRRLAVMDLRTVGEEDERSRHLPNFLEKLGWYTSLSGMEPAIYRDLKRYEVPASDLVASTSRLVGEYDRADAEDIAWLCLVDHKVENFRGSGIPDLKPVVYETARNRIKQSIMNPAILRAVKKPRSDKSRAEAPLIMGDVPAQIRLAFIELSLTCEIAAGKLLRPRTWLDEAQEYVFIASVAGEFETAYAYLVIGADGSLQFGKTERHRDLQRIAAEHGRRILTVSAADMAVLPDALCLEATDMRSLPPGFDNGRAGWRDLLSVCTYPELDCYSASYFDVPNNGLEKGVVLRRIVNGQPGDLERIAMLCGDTTVKLESATVIPAPFKLLREWAGITSEHEDEGGYEE